MVCSASVVHGESLSKLDILALTVTNSDKVPGSRELGPHLAGSGSKESAWSESVGGTIESALSDLTLSTWTHQRTSKPISWVRLSNAHRITIRVHQMLKIDLKGGNFLYWMSNPSNMHVRIQVARYLIHFWFLYNVYVCVLQTIYGFNSESEKQ